MKIRQRHVVQRLRALLNDPAIAPEELSDAAVTILERRLSASAWATYQQGCVSFQTT